MCGIAGLVAPEQLDSSRQGSIQAAMAELLHRVVALKPYRWLRVICVPAILAYPSSILRPAATSQYIARTSTVHWLVADPKELAQDLDDMIAAQGELFGSKGIYGPIPRL